MITFFRHYLFLTPIVVLVLCELTKLLVHMIRTGEWHEKLFVPGGFPSTHSAFVTSMLIIVAHKSDIGSPEFVIALCISAITWYDAIFVRRELGLQAHVLNKLQKRAHLRERLGHTLLEVLGGIAFGAFFTMLGIALA